MRDSAHVEPLPEDVLWRLCLVGMTEECETDVVRVNILKLTLEERVVGLANQTG